MKTESKAKWVCGALLLGAIAVGVVGYSTREPGASERMRRALVGAEDEWTSRTVWACDQRKMVIVEGVRPGEKIPHERAQLVADVLQDLMRFCNEEITARLAIDQSITVAANGRGDEIGGNGVACAMCHPNAVNTHPETYPKFQTQLKKVALLRDMVNWCIENPLEGKPLPDGDPRMKALEAYVLAKRAGVALAAGKH